MKILWYSLTAVFGLYGILGVFRALERLVFGAFFLPAPLLLSIIALFLAGVCLRKARAGSRHK
jgi:hypothetical protein